MTVTLTIRVVMICKKTVNKKGCQRFLVVVTIDKVESPNSFVFYS